MPDYTYVLYDTVPMGATANTETVLFQTAQGADSTHTELYTNSRGAGALPSNEEFSIEKISCVVDVNGVVADQQNAFLNSYLDIVVNNKSVFKAPCALLADRSSFGGAYTQATAAAESLMGLQGNGYELKIPIKIPKGSPFKVRHFQGTALSTTGQNLKVCLHGTLSTP